MLLRNPRAPDAGRRGTRRGDDGQALDRRRVSLKTQGASYVMGRAALAAASLAASRLSALVVDVYSSGTSKEKASE